jgi:hypothetical protein
MLTIVRACYGLHTSGSCWHDSFADVMRITGDLRRKADIHMCVIECTTCYEDVLVYLGDIVSIGKEPQQFFDALANHHINFKTVYRILYYYEKRYHPETETSISLGITNHYLVLFNA